MRTTKPLFILLTILLFFASATAAPDYTDHELAEKFAPYIVLASGEPYEPINADWFIRSSQIREDRPLAVDTVVESSPTVNDLWSYDNSKYYLDLEDEYLDSYNLYAPSGNTVYYRVEDIVGGKILQYWLFYPNSRYSLDLFGVVEHEADWEMIQFYLDDDKHLFPSKSGYSQHYVGRKSHWTQQTKSGTHPVAYPSYSGHATYYTSGYHSKDCHKQTNIKSCTGGESSGGGETLAPTDYELLDVEEQEWFNWAGEWGERLGDGIISSRITGPTQRTGYFGYNLWSDSIGWLEAREEYKTGADIPDYSSPSIASFREPAEVNPGESVTFGVSASDDQEYLEYHWDLGDGVTTMASDALTHSYSDGGDYTVEVAVVDNEGASAVRAITYHVNQYPEAVFSLIQDTVKTFEDIDLSENSNDPDGTITSRTWAFGNRESKAQLPDISFEDDGNYEITLQVEDDNGLTNTATKTITVLNRDPEASFSRTPQTVYYDTNVEFQSTASDRDGDVVDTDWSIDGTDETTDASWQTVFRDATGGISSYDITLKVRDDDGATNTVTKTIDIANKEPKAEFTANTTTATPGEPVRFVSQATDEDGSITATDWDLGDGTTSTNEEVVHSYDAEGTYTVTHTVTDPAGSTTSTTKQITVGSKGILDSLLPNTSSDGFLNSVVTFLNNLF